MPTTPPPRQRSTQRSALSLDASKGANQDDAAGADINTIVAQYKRHGTLPAVQLRNPLYGDFTLPEDIHGAREAMLQAEERFAELPASVRTDANNDWVTFLEMFNTDEGRQSLSDHGLIVIDTPPELVPDPAPAPEPTE